jgi:Tfp pilus assembly PilM family ATPase
MRESNVTIKSAVISIPSLSSLIFTISLPSKIVESQLAKIIPIEARKYIPVPISEVTLDWFIIPKEVDSFEDEEKEKKEDKIDILIIAIHNDILNKYQDILKKTNLQF